MSMSTSMSSSPQATSSSASASDGLLVLSQRDVDSLLFGTASGGPAQTTTERGRITPEEILDSQREVFRAVSGVSLQGERKQEQGQGQEQGKGGEDVLKPYENPQRLGVGMRRYGGLFMPARLGDTTTCKIVSVPRGVPLRLAGSASSSSDPLPPPSGLPGSTLLLDSDTGAVSAIVNATSLTALRTAAGSMLATVHFKPPSEGPPLSVLIFGLGNQAFFHAWFLLHLYGTARPGRELRGLRRITLANLARPKERWSAQARETEARLRALVDEVNRAGAGAGTQSEIDVETTDDEAQMYARLQEADVVCCCTPSLAPLFDSGIAANDAGGSEGQGTSKSEGWKIKPDAHFNLVGAYKPHMREIDAGLVRAAAGAGPHQGHPGSGSGKGSPSRLVLDSREACAHEAGDVLQAGVDPLDGVACRELGELDGGEGKAEEGREQATGPSVFKSVGVGLQDVAVTRVVVEAARRMGVGTVVDF